MSRAKIVMIVLLMVALTSARGQDPSPEAQLPDWAQQRWGSLANRASLRLSTRLKPFFLQADFNGDGENDVALFVKDVATGKEGLAFLFKGKAAPVVIGAGKTFGNGGDDFSWVDTWKVADTASSPRRKGVRASVAGIILSKEDSASALIYIEKGNARWQQQGD